MGALRHASTSTSTIRRRSVLAVLDRAFTDAEIPNVGRDAAPAHRLHGHQGERHRVRGRVQHHRPVANTGAPTPRSVCTSMRRWRAQGFAISFQRRIDRAARRPAPRGRAGRASQAPARAGASSDLFGALTEDERAGARAGVDELPVRRRRHRCSAPARPPTRCTCWRRAVVRVVSATRRASATSSRGSPRRPISARWGCCSASRAPPPCSPTARRCAIGWTSEGFDAILQARPELADNLARVLAQAPGRERRDAARARRRSAGASCGEPRTTRARATRSSSSSGSSPSAATCGDRAAGGGRGRNARAARGDGG